MLLIAVSAQPLAAQAPESLQKPWSAAVPVDPNPSIRADVALLGGASVHALTGPLRWDDADLIRFAAAATGVAAVSLLDEGGRDVMARHRTPRNTGIEKAIEPFGAVGSLYLLGGGWATGVVSGDEKLRATAVEGMASSLVASVLITPALQNLFGRSKPRANEPAYTFNAFSGNYSFPSGHTTQAFAVASVVASEYDHPATVVAAYGLATAVGASRMYRRSHFVSDVVAAALIGTTVGRAVARYGQGRRQSATTPPAIQQGPARFELTPVVRNGQPYLLVRVGF